MLCLLNIFWNRLFPLIVATETSNLLLSRSSKLFGNRSYSASVGSLLIQIPRGSFGYSYIPRNMLYNLLSWNSRYFLLSSNAFSITLQRSPSLEGRHINEKVLLRLSSCDKSRKFETGMKMIAIAPTLRYILICQVNYIPLGVGLLLYPFQRQCESLLQG